jgi:CheY-like chemotaxis protein
VELAEVVERAVETSRPLLEARRHELSEQLPSGSVWLDADPIRLAQVIANLLSNAAKYTDERGLICLSAVEEGPEVVLRVQDNGIGMTADMLPRVFELFTQAEPALDRSHGGLGIGLTLVRLLVELHGGRVEARSDGPGKGSEFIVRLPCLRKPTPLSRRPEPVQAGYSTSSPRRILVVDDNVDAAGSLSALLEHAGHEVRTTHDGPGALEEARTFRPEVVLLDIGLPGMDGYEVAREIRRLTWGNETLLVAVTGYGQEEDRRCSREAGFDAHLVKPVDPEALRALLSASESIVPGTAS